MPPFAVSESQQIPHNAELNRPIETLKGVGPARLKHLRALGLTRVGELLEFFPRDYQQERAEGAIRDLRPEEVQTARGTVVAVDYIAGGRSRFEATIEDGSEKLSLTWFNGSYLRRAIHPGLLIRVRGRVKYFRNIPQMVNPKWELISDDAEPVGEDLFRAIYPASASLSSDTIGKIIAAELPNLLPHIDEWFDEPLLQSHGLLGRRDAFRLIHQPASPADSVRARRRLVYDELMLMQLALALSKRLRDGRITAPVMRVEKILDQRIRTRFPFQLTPAQDRAVWEIVGDLRGGRPMNRLLQGDVGSGKTVVALYGMLVAVANKMQAVLLAPTEVLAEQHFLTLSRLLKDSSVRIELVTGRTKRSSTGSTAAIANGSTHIAIGTQALIQEGVDFANLGLVVIDEQHKLGVRQRAVLKSKGYSPHYLVMTATPIPRTLALSYFADFDLSVIDALPPGRVPIATRWLKPNQANEVYSFVRAQVKAGRQAYLVLPQIETGVDTDAKGVRAEFERLSKGPLADLRLGMLHGQMSGDEKQSTMSAFRAGTIDVLVATTVIEVGIDVPNASTIVIDGADRFGLSQLHQLRGRVGRGSDASYCLLLSDASTDSAKARLEAMIRTTDGFEIADADLHLRGPGDIFGTRQHGLPEMKLADITQELELLEVARNDALNLLHNDPHLTLAGNQLLKTELDRKFGNTLQLAAVG